MMRNTNDATTAALEARLADLFSFAADSWKAREEIEDIHAELAEREEALAGAPALPTVTEADLDAMHADAFARLNGLHFEATMNEEAA